ncbi:lectin-like domain-containing protein [Secundilactobacillus yichangensis]|uniref:lectin-like domain-containing protein n=1 Tax=Secundilactobacillus yichangensis TaxID=2799580 RepID=UPI0019407D1C|nr:LPXTG cell wall anchor domain-containing protein [Secundilactobacillus yichangensis]
MPEKYQQSAQRLHAHEQPEVKTRVKLYKANGRWLAALVFALGMAIAVPAPTAQAASNPTTTVQQTAQVKSPTQANTDSTNIQQATPTKVPAKAALTSSTSTTPAAKTASTTDTPATSTGTDHSANTPAPKSVAKTELGSASAATIEATKQAKVAVYQTTGQPQEITAQDSTAPSEVKVNANNFTDYFKLNGSATYNQSTGTLTLTTDQGSQDGNATLKNKIDLNQSFKLTGQINLGNKAQKPGRNAGPDGNALGGGDGVAFAFHNGNTDLVGGNGAGVGIGGLKGAFGWKADTFFDGVDEPTGSVAKADPNEFWTNPQSDADGQLVYGVGSPYGSFIYTDPTTGMVTAYAPTNDTAGEAQLIDQPSNNEFKPITISYDGSTKTMTVTYDGKTWSHAITDWATQPDAAFLISGGTAGAKNLQQFQIDSFDYFTAATVNVKYVNEQTGDLLGTGVATYTDANGNPLTTGQASQAGDQYATQSEQFNGYVFDKMMTGSLPATGTLKINGDNGTVTFGYTNIVPVTPDKPYDADPKDFTATSTRTINYVKTSDGSVVHAPEIQTVTFTRTGTEDLLTKKVTFGEWTPVQSDTLAAVVSPTIKGYTPDQSTVPATTLAKPNMNPTVTVHYSLSTQKATVTYKDDTSNKTLGDIDTLSGESGTTATYSSASRIQEYENQGYTLVSDGTANGIVFDNDTATDQPFTVEFVHKMETVTPKTPHDADPAKLTATATRTINYINASDSTPIAPAVVQTIDFTRTGTEDAVTKEVTYNNDWQPANAQVPAAISPFVQGFAPDQETVPAATLSHGDKETITVKYYKVGLGNNIQTKTQVGQPLYAIAFTGQPTGPNGEPIGNPIPLIGNPGEPIGFGSLTDIPGYFLVPNQNLVVPKTPGATVPILYDEPPYTNGPSTTEPNTVVPNTEEPNNNEPKANVPSTPESNDNNQGHVVPGGSTSTTTGTNTQGHVAAGNATSTEDGIATPTGSATQSANVSSAAPASSQSSQLSGNKQTTDKRTLPQTDETPVQGTAALGFLGVFVSLFGLVGTKKRRKNL